MRFPAVSVRWKIALTVMAVSCAVAAVFGVLVHNEVARHIVADIRKETRENLDTALDAFEYGTSREGVNPLLDPAELPAGLGRLVRSGQRGTMVGTYRDRPVMWAAAPAGGRVLAVWHSYANTRHSLEELDTVILGSAVLAATAVTLAGLLLAHRMSRRLATTAAVARRITAGDLDARVGDGEDLRRPGRGPAGQDEVAAVAAALDSVAGSLQSRLQAEQRFTADVAHELRTPLTGTLAAAELLPEGRPKEMIIDRLRALHRLTEDLLEISRLDSGTERADFGAYELGALIERAVRATGLDTEVRIVSETVVETDRRRLDRIVGNLVLNAHRHGRPPVVVTVDAPPGGLPTVEVRDHGPGYPDDLLHHGPRRFRTDAPGRGKGHGLGLTIAVGQAAVLGIDLCFSNAPDGGARATLYLAHGSSAAPP
ncbi:putative two-component histidine kinase [Streptomyces sp. NBRC 110611]|uniref:sensor histidine kinase n=1 Tax=Streptomyces sp. NBRC 110611 TaxID=1621259 RepID=UPI00082CA889|nr:HAMP domain-containing sensor histidine kinase [Streptomyces sp. NBRC 110611]GAU67437.1 putative two-component histidine kinase [Streptomyces sp. NBRC 110611]